MEYLICDLIVKLRLRRKCELERTQLFNKETDKELLLISSGKIFELDQLIGYLDDMLKYNTNTKNIAQ